MRPVHLACIGPSHHVYAVKAVKETLAGAQEVLKRYLELRRLQPLDARAPQADCGFVLSWVMIGDLESESMGDPVFVWDDREARKKAPPTRVKTVC